MSVTPLEFDAGVINEDDDEKTVTATFTVSNTGTASGTYTATKEAEITWITLSGDVTGTVAIDGTKTFDAVIDATELEPGTYEATITVTTSDVENPTFEITCTLEVEEGVGIYTINGIQTKIYPNPASNTITVESGVIINEIQIINQLGQVVSTTAVNGEKSNIDISNLSAGVYFVKINTASGAHSSKLIVK